MWCRVVARSNTDLQRVIDRVLSDAGIVRCSTVIALATQVPHRVLPRSVGGPDRALGLSPFSRGAPPARWTRSIASRRSRTWSFSRIRLTWLRTVIGEMNSAAPISLLLSPSATSASTSRLARRERPGSSSVDVRRLRSAAEVVEDPGCQGGPEHRVPLGDRADGGQHLGGVGALDQVAARPGADRRQHGGVVLEHGEDQHPGTSGVADRAGGRDPVQPGIRTSITTTSTGSGRRGSSARRTASWPSSTSSTSTRSSAWPRMKRSPSRNTGWSSASSTRMVIGPPPPSS